MRGPLVVLLVVSATWFGLPEPSLAQDVLRAEKIKGLKGLESVALVLREDAPLEVMSRKQWSDRLEVRLSREAPELGRSDPKNAPAWLELSIISSHDGGVVELSLYRWAMGLIRFRGQVS